MGHLLQWKEGKDTHIDGWPAFVHALAVSAVGLQQGRAIHMDLHPACGAVLHYYGQKYKCTTPFLWSAEPDLEGEEAAEKQEQEGGRFAQQ